MSERITLKNLDAPQEQEVSELNDLRASKDLGFKSANSDLANSTNTDLSQISIAAAGVERLSQRPDKRIIRPGANSATSNEAVSQGASRQRKAPSAEVGVFKNPYYPYQGSIIDRFVALVANIFKALEKLILKLLGGADAPLPRPAQHPIAAKKTLSDTEELEEKKRRAEQARQRELDIHRS